MTSAVFCADIGGSFIKFGVSRHPGEMEECGKVPTPVSSWDDFVQAMQNLIARFGADLPAATPLAISTAGLVSPQTGEMLATNIPAFTGHSLAKDLSVALARPVTAANDADCFALAEAHAGNAQHHAVVVAIILGTGVGGGVVINGQLVRGHGGVTGEWGHGAITRTQVEIDGETYSVPRLKCGCGQTGCLDMLGAARGLERLHTHFHQQDKTSLEIVNGWKAGDAACGLTVNIWLEVVSEPLALLVNILGPSRIVAGGGLASASELIAALDVKVRGGVLHTYTEPLLVPGKFLTDGGLVGASVMGRIGS